MTSKRDSQLFKIVAEFWERENHGPTIRDIAYITGLSYPGAAWSIQRAIHNGVLTRVPGRHRDLRIAPDYGRCNICQGAGVLPVMLGHTNGSGMFAGVDVQKCGGCDGSGVGANG